MPAAQRLDWLIAQIANGRATTVSFSFNEATQREKVKFVLWNSFAACHVYRPAVLGALQSVSYAISHSIVTDKGHQSHTQGSSVIEFWIKQPPLEPAPSEPAPSITQVDHAKDNEDTGVSDAPTLVPEAAQLDAAPSVVHPLVAAVANMESLLESSRVDVDQMSQKLAAAQVSSSNMTSGVVPESSLSEQPPGMAPYTSSFLEKLSHASGSKDDKAMNLFLNRHGDVESVLRSLEGIEKYFAGRLDIVAAFLAKQVAMPPTYGRSRNSFKSVVLETLSDETMKQRDSLSLGIVLDHASKQSPPPSPEKLHGKSRRKK